MYKRSSLLQLCKNWYFVYFCITQKKIGSVEVWYSEYFEIIVVYSFFFLFKNIPMEIREPLYIANCFKSTYHRQTWLIVIKIYVKKKKTHKNPPKTDKPGKPVAIVFKQIHVHALLFFYNSCKIALKYSFDNLNIVAIQLYSVCIIENNLELLTFENSIATAR